MKMTAEEKEWLRRTEEDIIRFRRALVKLYIAKLKKKPPK